MDKEKILQAMKAVKPALADKEVVEQTTSFAFKNKKIYAYNDDIMISHPIDLDIEGSVSAKELYNLLSRTKELEVEIKQEAEELLISSKGKGKSKGFRAGISFNSNIVMPIDKVVIKKEWNKLPDNFNEALRFCFSSVSSDFSKPLITCVHVKDSMMESCDNVFRYSKYILDSKVKDNMLFTPKAKEVLLYNVTHYQNAKSWVHCKNAEGVVFSFRTYEGSYPDTSAFLEMSEEKKIKFPSNLLSSLETAESLCEENFVTKEKTVKITLEGTKIVLRGKGKEGWYEEEFDTKRNYKKKIVFESNTDILKDSLAHLKKACISGRGDKLRFETDNFIHIILLFT